MKVKEIHNEFMLLAQQMGMKSVRAILPEELDRLINLEAIEYVKDVFSRKGNRELDGISDNVIRLTELSSLHTSIKLEAEQGDIMFGTGYKIELNTNTTNELSDVAMKEVIKRAVNTYNAISNNNSYEKVSNELSKLE